MQPRSAVADAIEQAGAAAFYVKGIDTQRLIKHLLALHAARTCRESSETVMSTRPRVLLAEDHPGVVRALRRVLSRSVTSSALVDDGREVAGAAARLEPVVSVVDLHLPNVSGLEACRRIMRTNPRAKVILITAADRRRDQDGSSGRRSVGMLLKTDGGH